MVREILLGSMNIPSDISGLERKKEFDGEIIESPCPLGCGANARRFTGKYGFYWKCRCSSDVFFKDVDEIPVVMDGFDCRERKKEVVYRDTYIPRKAKREELRRESILVAEAVKLAKTIITSG